jgi:hypothetical protein
MARFYKNLERCLGVLAVVLLVLGVLTVSPYAWGDPGDCGSCPTSQFCVNGICSFGCNNGTQCDAGAYTHCKYDVTIQNCTLGDCNSSNSQCTACRCKRVPGYQLCYCS